MTFFRRRWPLLAVTVGLAVVEAGLLQGAHFVSAVPLAPQLSAPAPFGVYHDLRWVWTFASGPASMAWTLVALLAFRSVVDAAIVALAWPDGVPRPSYGVLLGRSVPYTLLALVVLSPWAAATFAGAVTGFADLLLPAIILVGVLALVLPAAPVTGDWWRRVLSWRTAGYVALSWVEVNLAALAITVSPGWVCLAAAAASGVFNAWVWSRIVATLVAAARPRGSLPVRPVTAVLVSGALVVAGGFALRGLRVGSRPPASATGALPRGPLTRPVIFVPGFDSSYAGGVPHLFGPRVQTAHYSYRGLSPAGKPLPYGPLQTHQLLQASGHRLAVQVRTLHRRSGRPVAVVAESEGTMVARAYFAHHPHPPVDVYVQTSPLLRPARVYLPPGLYDGSGYAGGLQVRAVLGLFRLESPGLRLSADMPFIRSLVEHAATYRGQTLCPPPGVHSYLYLPLEGALTVPRGPLSRIPWTAIPAYHAELIGTERARHDIARILTGHPAPTHGGAKTAYLLIRGAAGAWQSPALPLRQRSAWRARPGSDPAFGHQHCLRTRETSRG